MNLLDYFPYEEPREIQKQVLEVLGDDWDRYDVFVISAPTAFGKTGIAKTLMQALHSVSVITPTNLLVDQFRAEFPDTPTLSRLDSYYCDLWKRPCAATRARLRGFCSKKETGCECPASRDLATAKYRRGPGIYNYHAYLAHKLYRDTLVVDEAHNLLPNIRERMSLVLWRHKTGYPESMRTPEQMRSWVSSLSESRRKGKGIATLEAALRSPSPEYIPYRTRREFAGKGTLRGQPEMRDCIELVPVDISTAPPMYWPKDVKKIVLLSATIGRKDIPALGLHRKRVLYLDCKSPIDPERRPVVIDPQFSVSRNAIGTTLPRLVEYIEQVAAAHPHEKGVIHATYAMAQLLRGTLQGPRYLFHEKEERREVYQRFREAPPESGAILVACGMYEGIDLPEDLGRWQIIAKVPWPSLGDPGVDYQMRKDPEWYLWETARKWIQACGRICRTPTDFGVTVCPDSSVERLLREGKHLFPSWLLDGIEEGRKYVG